MRFQFIDEHNNEYPITLMCRVLDVSRSGYYAWRERPPGVREMADQELLEKIKVVHKQSRGRYGSPRSVAAIRDSL